MSPVEQALLVMLESLSNRFSFVQAIGSGLRRLSVAWRNAVGSKHHTRVTCSLQWRTKTRRSIHGGVALTQARERNEKTYRELRGPGSRARLVILALWSA